MTVDWLNHFVDYYKTRLFLYNLRLDNYRSSALPQSFLDALDARFAAGRTAGVKFILLPTYNYDSSAADAPINIVLQHISQLKPILAKYADVLPYMKAGFIGAWGEWNSSTNGLDSDANRKIIKDALLANTPSSMIVHFRQPDDFAKWFPNNPAGAAAARIGFHNDCYMANSTDAHTYNSLTDPMRDYTKTMTQTTSFGGETCDHPDNATARMTCAQALSEHAAYHLNWLNINYSANFINGWKSGGCFDQISRTMGYRLQLDGLNHSSSASKGTAIAFNVNLRNTGWSRMFSKRPLVITLRNKSTGATITGSGGDLSTVASSASAQITVNVSVPTSAASGDYDVQISAPDIYSTNSGDARYAVHFANSDSGSQAWNSSTGRFSAGTSLTVQ
jgi:hypothetical protein